MVTKRQVINVLNDYSENNILKVENIESYNLDMEIKDILVINKGDIFHNGLKGLIKNFKVVFSDGELIISDK